MYDDDFYNRAPSFFGLAPAARPLSAAGRMLNRINRAEQAITGKDDITDEMHAALRRCQVRSRWNSWDQKNTQSNARSSGLASI